METCEPRFAQIQSERMVSSREFSAHTRKQNLELMRDQLFDLVVIGGGITGAAIARDAVLRGFRVALLEKGDFASGTSSRSSKLVHGGLRYLRHMKFGLVFGALRERWILMQNAPRLVKPLTFLIPVYKDARTGRLMLSMGLWLYDILALFRTPRFHGWLSPEKALDLEPALRKDELIGVGLYADCATDDARLVLALIKDAWSHGALVANYTEVAGFEKDGGRVVGVKAVDLTAEMQFTVRAKIVVNATGPWSDNMRRLDDPSSEPKLRPAKGVHIVVPRERLGNNGAVVIESRRDGRIMFVIPWGNLSLVGTTDTDYEGDLGHVSASEEDIEYLLEALNQTYPESQITSEDIVSLYASVRPLAGELGVSEDAVSRDQLIFESNSGLVSIIGGKLTTHRSMAKALVDQASLKLAAEFATPAKRPCETDRLALDYDQNELERAVKDLQKSGLNAESARHLVDAYGLGATKVLEITEEKPSLASRITTETLYLFAEVVYAVRYEMALKLVDFMLRRTQLAYRLKDHGASIVQNVAALMAKELGWSAETIAEELIEFENACELIEPQ
jgi:glycerol-3-phosphate dehydrogenase